MTDITTGSWSIFVPEEVIERIEVHLKRIEIIKNDAKEEWYKEKREEGNTTGFWFFKETKPWTEEELDEYWASGPPNRDAWYYFPPKYRIWDKWDTTINNFERIRDFCQLAIDAGNRTVNLSKEDALFAYNWS